MKHSSAYIAKDDIKTVYNKWLSQTAAFALLGSTLIIGLPLSANAAVSQTKIDQNYEDSCAVCHSSGVLNAPKTGDNAAWSKLKSEKGIDGLVKSVKNGVSQMPAGGLCQNCSDEDYRSLIDYMSK